MPNRRSYRVFTDDRLFTLEVSLIDGPMTKAFIKKNKTISRTFQLRGDTSLEEFHLAIFRAFNRYDEHLFLFEFGGKEPHDYNARRYLIPYEDDLDFEMEDEKPAGDIYATIGSIDPKFGEVFFYWFDFGDDWWHAIKVLSINEKAPRGKFPKLVKSLSVGESPPQYAQDGELSTWSAAWRKPEISRKPKKAQSK